MKEEAITKSSKNHFVMFDSHKYLDVTQSKRRDQNIRFSMEI